MQHFLPFIGASALLLILPGPTNALLMAAGASQPILRAVPLILAELIAYALAITPLLVFNEMLGSWRDIGGLALKSVALAAVLILAWRMWRRAGKTTASGGGLVSRSSIFWMTLFNPKSLVFAFAIFPPIQGDADARTKAALFVILAVATGAVWVTIGAMISGGGRRMHDGWIGKIAALVLCGFAVYLGTSVVSGAAAIFNPAI